MSRLRNFVQHRFNSVHVYCRLCDCRIPAQLALKLSAVWESLYVRPFWPAVCLLALAVLASCSVPAQAKHLHKERYYQNIWCAQNTGTLEVRLPGGLRIDCETETHAVEVDFAPKWAEAVGQSLAYAAATGKRPGILLILERPTDERHLAKLHALIDYYGVPIDVWTIEPAEEAQP
ncbi:hypothetical protein [Solidesulfovibrio sp.]